MNMLAYDPYIDRDSVPVVESRATLTTMDCVLADSDFVTCHLPGGQETRGILDYGRFCQMRPSAYFVNVARGEVVDEPGLVRALTEGKIAGAALDVRAVEPPGASALDRMDNVILMPHVAAFTREAQHRVVASVYRDVEAVLAGRPATGYANFPSPRR